ncbi:MAG TPA: sugar ABC transporter permease [Clostridiaceae bacterium]|nr:sugar ABC transporter permease [Clostridiaceae bacterium]
MKRSKSIFAIFVLPAFILYTLFMLYPLISSLGLSFFSWTGYGAKTYVGLNNFIKLFTRPEHFVRFIGAIKNNVLFFIYTILFQNIVGLILAAFINLNIKGAKFFRSVYFIPTTLSIVVVGFLWKLIYNPIWGPLNVGLRAIGLDSMAMAWLGNESTALICISIANAWQYVGIPVILFLAGMQGIPDELYESSELDGATGIKQFWKITFPLIAPVIFIITTIVFVSNFSAFEIIYAMTGTLGAPNYSTDILGTLFYRICFGQRLGTPPDMGMGAVIASCMFIIIVVGVLIWFKIYGERETGY